MLKKILWFNDLLLIIIILICASVTEATGSIYSAFVSVGMMIGALIFEVSNFLYIRYLKKHYKDF